jgi:DNA polymerase III epsilon subunit-like protein
MSLGMLAELGFEARRVPTQTAVQSAPKPTQLPLAAAQTPPVYVVLDTETSGRGATHQPIEIAAKAINADGTPAVPARCFWVRLRLFEGVRLDPTALAVHGLDCESPEWNRTASDPVEALKRFAAWWPANALLVAHNATFDVGMLTHAFERAGLPCPSWAPAGEKPLCTMQLARRNGFKPSGLEALCDRFGVSNEGAHGARADVNRLIAVWPHIQKRAA